MKLSIIAAALVCATVASAQSASDAATQIRQVLPTSVAQHVLATIADARAKGLPAAALEQQALRLARQGTQPADVEKSVDRRAQNMTRAKLALEQAGRKPANDEIVAGSALISQGVDGKQVREWAKTAPTDRNLSVAFNVTASLMGRGLPADKALAAVNAKLSEKATDRQLLAEANSMAAQHRPATANKQGGLSHRPASPGAALRPVTPPAPVATPGPRG